MSRLRVRSKWPELYKFFVFLAALVLLLLSAFQSERRPPPFTFHMPNTADNHGLIMETLSKLVGIVAAKGIAAPPALAAGVVSRLGPRAGDRAGPQHVFQARTGRVAACQRGAHPAPHAVNCA